MKIRSALILPVLISLLSWVDLFAGSDNPGKAIYIPRMFGNADPEDPNSRWTYTRSQQSENFILFWEAGYGQDPAKSEDATFRVDVGAVLEIAEKSYAVYRDTLKFVIEGESQTDRYKMIILLYHNEDWMANGSGVDDTVGLLSLSASAARALGVTVAHEVGHCFQYQVGCDEHPGGWRYGFGENGSGGNGWWEQCAQWQAFQVLPEAQFERAGAHLRKSHLHVLHESARYDNFFLPDYWAFKHGIDIVGKLWRESRRPEDPIEAYKRLTGITQEALNNEMYERAARFATWDLPALRKRGEGRWGERPQPELIGTDDGAWRIAPSHCVQNYGYNVIRLNLPQENPVGVHFEGLLDAAGYRYPRGTGAAGWRYGLVALTASGERVYGRMRIPSTKAGSSNPEDLVYFECPEDAVRLWLVVTGAPTEHWRHPWDDDVRNDEQWPYQVQFKNTQPYGTFSFSNDARPRSITLSHSLNLVPRADPSGPYPSTQVEIDVEAICRALNLNLDEFKNKLGGEITYGAIAPNGDWNSTSTAHAPGHWFDSTGRPTEWGNDCFVFSEFSPEILSFQIGQYPGAAKPGDRVQLQQGFEYRPETGEPVRVTCEFDIRFAD